MKERVLIVEDEKELSEAYEMVLDSQDYEVKTAYDGEMALKVAKEFKPDLILLDLRMPRMGGIEFLKKYDLASVHPDVKVIVFSNMDSQTEIDAAYDLGVDKYILKAWASPKELLKLVEEVLTKKKVA